ncbi:hypothetical protein ACFE04_027098 [Oxalis oulophora]
MQRAGTHIITVDSDQSGLCAFKDGPRLVDIFPLDVPIGRCEGPIDSVGVPSFSVAPMCPLGSLPKAQEAPITAGQPHKDRDGKIPPQPPLKKEFLPLIFEKAEDFQLRSEGRQDMVAIQPIEQPRSDRKRGVTDRVDGALVLPDSS